MPQETSRAGTVGALAGTPPMPRRTVVWRVLAVGLSFTLLWSTAALLTRTAHDQRVRRAGGAVAAAAVAHEAGRAEQEVALLREAVALEPRQPEHRLALAKALVSLGRSAEAEPYVQEVLREQPVNGEANLLLAGIHDERGNREEAERAFYAAIYGRWPASEQASRMRARLQLVEWYRRAGQQDRLRAALIELAGAFPGDRALQLEAGRLLLQAGFGDDAARQLRVVVERFADAGDALTLLAEAEFKNGRYAEANAAARAAEAREPKDARASELRALTTKVLELDPDLPRLSARERTARLRVLMAAVRSRLASCGDAQGEGRDDLLALVDQWLARRNADSELGRALIAGAARRLPSTCLPAPDGDAVARVLADLATDGRR